MLTITYQQLICERDKLILQLKELDEKTRKLPEGDLLCVKNGRYTKWFLSSGSSPIYLPKEKRPTAESLAVKKYYSLQMAELSQKLNLLEQWLKLYGDGQTKSEMLLDDSSPFKELLVSYFQTLFKEGTGWMAEDYMQNQAHPEHLIHSTLSGHKVRSKSEVIIANSLFTSQIPYRYECALSLQGMIFFPDFTILHPQTEEILYWEHFGMMDNPSYSESAFNKLKIYAAHGIIPTVNLITTYETQKRPIDSEKVMQVIQEYFL